MTEDKKNDTLTMVTTPVDSIVCHECQSELDVSEMPSLTSFKCPVCETKLTVACKLDGYLLINLLGEGGMALVFEAIDEMLQRHVAIKIMRREMAQDAKWAAQFIHEARAAANIMSQNVVQIMSVGEKQGHPYIVMELIQGGKLDKLIKSGKPLTETHVLRTGIDVAKGLMAAKEIGIIHGDVKPGNVLFDHHNVAKIADFGLSRFARKKKKLAPHEVWGTPNYIAPEKAKDHTEDFRSDIYSLGATLFHAFTGRVPFTGRSAVEVVAARLAMPAPDVRSLREDLHDVTAAIVARTLEADPFKRYPTYKSLIADMTDALNDLSDQGCLVRRYGCHTEKRRRGMYTETRRRDTKHKRDPVAAPRRFLLGWLIGVVVPILLIIAGAAAFRWYDNGPQHSHGRGDATGTVAPVRSEPKYEAEPDPRPGQILYWRFDEPTGRQARDSSGEKNRGKLYYMNEHSRVPGVVNRALLFNGKNAYVLEHSLSHDLIEDAAVSFWFTATNNAARKVDFQIECMIDLALKESHGLQIGLGIKQYPGRIMLNSDQMRMIRTQHDYRNGKWHHVVLMRHERRCSLFVNGRRIATVPCDPVTYTRFFVGKRNGDPKFPFAGAIDEVRLFNRALADYEVAALYDEIAGQERDDIGKPREGREAAPPPEPDKTGTNVVTALIAISNLAHGKTARYGHVDSKMYHTAWEKGGDAAVVVDGDMTTSCGTHHADLDQWIGVDLGADIAINRMNLVWESEKHRAVDYRIEVAADAETWSAVKTVTGNAALETHDVFPVVTTRYARVYITSGGLDKPDNHGYRSRVKLQELRVFGPARNRVAGADNAKNE